MTRVGCLVALAAAGSLALASSPRAAGPLVVAKTSTFTSAPLGLTVVAGEVALPAGFWEVSAVTPAKTLEQIVLVTDAALDDVAVGRRLQAVETERKIQEGRHPLETLFFACRDWANTHGGVGPNAIADLAATRFRAMLPSLDAYILVPGVPIDPVSRPAVPRPPSPTVPLAVEVRPYVDDGKHWVLLSNGQVERRPIDPALLARLNVRLTFVLPRDAAATPSAPTGATHTVYALLRNPGVGAATLTLTEEVTGARLTVRWSLAGARPATAPLLGAWAQARSWQWEPLAPFAPILQTWTARTGDLYGAPRNEAAGRGIGREAARTTDVFAILGGRAALRETLQLELLRPRAGGAEPATVPLATLKGVEVKSHPFSQMLAGRDGGRLPLADHVPADRLFIYFAKPAALFPFLEQGSEFLFRAGGLFTKNAVDDDLKGRYLRRLGLVEGQARRLLESGEVTELALVTPDLFFIDGTDVSVVLRFKSESIAEQVVQAGRAPQRARQGDLVVLSTSRAELDAIQALGPAAGAGSLGRSAEFRYMLTQLPLKPETRALAYLSDPFIRRMVGPAVKIAQLRRMRARAQMEMITAGALLAILDGATDKPQLDRLVQQGYVPAAAAAGGYRLRDDLAAVSPLWGSAAELAPLGAAPFDRVTASEAQAYRAYVDEYSRYWRQYFDPVALRLDDAPGGALELSTFILPLLDSQLYDQVRGLLAAREGGTTLRVPSVTPDPVFLLSLNLTEDAWTKISGSWSQMFSGYTGISPEIFDRLGPGLHVAVQDADPILVLGNADLLGSFAGPALTADLMSRGLPLLLSVLTRPCKILVELQDEQAVLGILKRATVGGGGQEGRREMAVEFRQVEGKNAWIYSLSVPGLIKIRLGMEVKNGYLVVSNIPWSEPVAIKTVERRELNGAELTLVPGAVRLGLPGLFAAQSEQNQQAALHGIAALSPLLLTVSATPEEATARYAALFGARPLHPGPGTWVWNNGRLASSAYGTPIRWKTPAYRPEAGDFGLFEGVTRLSVNMQLEAGGLRAVSRWVWKGK